MLPECSLDTEIFCLLAINTVSTFYLTNIGCHFPPLFRRACGRSVVWITFTR